MATQDSSHPADCEACKAEPLAQIGTIMIPDAVIGISGDIRAGKTTLAAALASVCGGRARSNSHVLRQILDCLGIQHSRQDYARLASCIFREYGHDILVSAHLAAASKEPAPAAGRAEMRLLAIDGIRYVSEAITWKRSCRFWLVYVDTRPEVRYRRAMTMPHNEKEGEQGMSFERFAAHDASDGERELPQLRSMADLRFDNNTEEMSELALGRRLAAALSLH